MAGTLNFKLCVHFMEELTMIQIVFREINSHTSLPHYAATESVQ